MPLDLPARRVNVTRSLGACQTDRQDEPETATVRVDEALYRGQRAGRNQVSMA